MSKFTAFTDSQNKFFNQNARWGKLTIAESYDLLDRLTRERDELIKTLDEFVSVTSFHDPQYDPDTDRPRDCGCEFCQVRASAIAALNNCVKGRQ